MRLGVLDVGSNTVHFLVVDAHRGARPLPAFSHKAELRLADHLEDGNRLTVTGERQLRAFVSEALRIAEDKGVEDLLPFATSAVRDAVNGEEVLARIRGDLRVDIRVLAGPDESALTFLAARRWFGWSSGRLLVLDIGGGSLEIASGIDEEPDVAISLPLGAGRLTRGWLTGDPPSAKQARALRKHVRTEIARTAGEVLRNGQPDHAVATSKTFRQLARITGAAPSEEGVYVRRNLQHAELTPWAERLATMTAGQRTELPGVSATRAPQLLAGAIVADAAMDLFSLEDLELCPWALREGVILRRLDGMAGRSDVPNGADGRANRTIPADRDGAASRD
jgi:exopolyphosphatase / guanosine-5'-triphosphate,3'-diphosphate pyrophosphatase